MSHGYVPVQWNTNKRTYDLIILLGIIAYVGLFMAIGSTIGAPDTSISPEILLIRAFGSCAFLMLTLILCIGPMARLSPRFAPMLYNRRHLGVATFVVALVHFGIALAWYHGFGVDNPFISMLTSNPRYGSFGGFPFEALGFVAFLILFVMASTSHDYWLANLGAPIWKALHMAVYAAYGLLVMHVALGALQTEKSPVYVYLLLASVVVVAGLHILTGRREVRTDRTRTERDGRWIELPDPGTIPNKQARIVAIPGGDRIAVFRDGDKLFGIANACKHQNGPLGEGRIVDGCVTCPWHGFQYVPQTGASPPPFEEKIATYTLKAEGGRVWIDPNGNEPGTETAPLTFPGTAS
ncbi:Rieske 2Fe-2S domain-containing protein [Pyruvatibacter sp.]|uniref:Rieske 2Fe-2S domain-containing protein n=1 Tax=Pyruvatibacter sp. TaxID=1981328 RepID=UPI003265ED2D